MKMPPMVEDPNDPENLDYPTSRDVEGIKKISFNSDRNSSEIAQLGTRKSRGGTVEEWHGRPARESRARWARHIQALETKA